MATFVINEWLPEDCSGANGLTRQQEALRVITMLASSEHRIIVLAGSPFEQKFFNLCRRTEISIRGISRLYHLELRQNLDRCTTLRSEQAAALPDTLAEATKPDDHYLLGTQLAVPGAILVSTDGPLRAAASQHGLPCLSREDFLGTYL